MNKLFCLVIFLSTINFSNLKAQTYEYKTITSVESIVPSGLGRSRIVDHIENRDYKDFATVQSKSNTITNNAKREEIRVKNFEETKLLNFFNLGGIRFQNIASNDAVIASKINALASQGWELAFVNTGVESWGSATDNNGIFITRFIFKRLKR